MAPPRESPPKDKSPAIVLVNVGKTNVSITRHVIHKIIVHTIILSFFFLVDAIGRINIISIIGIYTALEKHPIANNNTIPIIFLIFILSLYNSFAHSTHANVIKLNTIVSYVYDAAKNNGVGINATNIKKSFFLFANLIAQNITKIYINKFPILPNA